LKLIINKVHGYIQEEPPGAYPGDYMLTLTLILTHGLVLDNAKFMPSH